MRDHPDGIYDNDSTGREISRLTTAYQAAYEAETGSPAFVGSGGVAIRDAAEGRTYARIPDADLQKLFRRIVSRNLSRGYAATIESVLKLAIHEHARKSVAPQAEEGTKWVRRFRRYISMAELQYLAKKHRPDAELSDVATLFMGNCDDRQGGPNTHVDKLTWDPAICQFFGMPTEEIDSSLGMEP